jgi:parallel beta-helix repeat protein
VALEQADGLFDLENDINRGDAGDPWYNSVIGFTEATIPNSNLYNGSLSGVRVTNISQSATIMTANLIVGWPPPTITFVSPTPSNNSVINVSYVYINITASEPLNTAILNWNGVNETMQGSGTNWHLNKTGLADGSYTFKVYGNDTAGNMNVSEIRVVTISTGGVNQIDSCQVISSPGVYVLTQDILNSSATKCIEITSSDVIFDGNGHTIDGLDTSNTYGVYVYNFSTLTNVTVKNLTVTDWYYGIYYQNTENGAIEDNNATSNYYGIFLFSSNYNTITNNTANSNDNHGIFLSSSSNYNTLSNNTAASNTYGGIYLWSSSNINTLSNNNATSNYYGIYLYSSTNNTLSNNSITSNSYGIRFYSSSNNTISDNLVSSNIYGAYLWSSNYNTLSNNNATSNSYGIYLYSSSHNTLSNNNVTSNSQQGIYLYYSSNYNTLSNNNATSNYYGIYLYSSSNYNTLSNNNATSNSYGIYLSSSNYNTITNNTANSNNNYGIYLSSSSNNNVVDNNNATSNYYGIYLYSSSNYNTITNNTVISNNFYGIYLSSSSNNLIYNNLFNNTNNFFISASYNTWNVAKQAGTNIVGGPYLGGNYWAKPDGTGFSETCDDLDADGICDSPYSLTTGNIDYLPLTAPPHVLGPEIDSCGVIASSGYYNLTMDILDSGDSSCIKIVSNNVTLDGAGHSIDGIDTSGTYGVYVSNSTITLTNITVKNLVVTDWSYGIYLQKYRKRNHL